jgi:dolichol-phosphate mannosyltransferase
VASRYIEGGGCPNWGLSRRIISRVALMISHLLLPSTRQVKDPLAGFFMFRRQNVDPEKLRPIGYKISLEVMLIGRFQHVVEVPYIFEDRSAGQSKLNPGQQIDYLKHLFSLMARTGELGMLIKFMLVGLSGVVVNEGVYWLLTRFGGLAAYDWLAVIIGIEVSIITNFILNDTFTFAKRRAGKSFMGRLLRFNLICLAGAAIQWGLFMLFTRLFGVYDLLSNFIGIVVAFLWNYFINRNWTWR